MLTLNTLPIPITTFPDGTSQVWRVAEAQFKQVNRITWEYENDSEFFHLAQLCDLIHTTPAAAVCLYMPYLPYGRQDKHIRNDSTFGLHTFASLLNSLHIERVDILDPHSEKALQLISRSKVVSPLPYIEAAITDCNPDTILFPDKGAQERYLSLIPYKTSFRGEKRRNPATGEIEKYSLEDWDVDISNRRVLIVDDICDGGATFVTATKLLKERGVTEVFLYTTHGIYSRGLGYLQSNGISRIYNRKGRIV